MNKRKYGNTLQNRIAKIFENAGYIVHNQKPHADRIKTKDGKEVWISRRNDIFGLFDIIAMNKNRLIFAQITGDSHISRKIKKIKKMKKITISGWSYIVPLLFTYNKRKRNWTVYNFKGEKIISGKISKITSWIFLLINSFRKEDRT